MTEIDTEAGKVARWEPFSGGELLALRDVLMASCERARSRGENEEPLHGALFAEVSAELGRR